MDKKCAENLDIFTNMSSDNTLILKADFQITGHICKSYFAFRDSVTLLQMWYC